MRRLPEEILPQGVLDAELDGYHRAGMLFSCDQAVDASLLARLEREYECVILACKGVGDDVPETIRAEGNKQTVRAVRSGKAAASRALHLLGIDLPDIAPAYDSNLGRISGEHVAPYLENRIDEESINRPRHPEIPGEEAGRCLHCDCHAPLSCKLRRYAAEYGARPRVFRDAERPGASVLKRAGRVLFDAGKCIKCGLCIEFARQGSEPVGLAFSGRGFDTRVKAPFDIALEVALTNTASECIALCPTGALAYDDQEEIQP